LRGARLGLKGVRHPGEVLARARAATEMLVRDELIAAPPSSLNQPIGGTRRYAAVRIPLDELKIIKRELGGTINDVVLALTAGGLRRLLLARGEQPPDGLRGQVPVNIREAGEGLALGNRLTSLYVHLPVAESDPRRRYKRVLREAEERKGGTQALGGRTIVEITNLAPPVLHEALAQTLFDVRLFNVTITNVPGPQQTLYSFGSPLREVLPLVPLFARHAVGIAAVSYAGDLTFGLNADRGTVPDLDVLAEGIRESLAELKALVPVAPGAVVPPRRVASPGPGR
jgi:WS/DGAT/MGAT family acyltransferase